MRKLFLLAVAAMIWVSLAAGCSGGQKDATAPDISTVSATDITETSIVITWSTDEPATSRVDYGLTSTYGSTVTIGTGLVTDHSVKLMGLTASTTYHYRVKSKDASNNEASSGDYTFATPDIIAPAISQVSADNITGISATVTWITAEAATSQVEYGLTDQYGLATALDVNLVTSHSVVLTGLSSYTTYHYRVNSKDASNRLGQSGDYTFTTNSANSIVISPAARTIMPGISQAYTAEAFDQLNNSLGDVTGSTLFSITPEAGGSWVTNVYTSQKAGAWTVTGNYSGLTDTAALTVNLGPAHHIVVSPAATTILAGNAQAYTAEVFDRFDNLIANVTSTTHFSMLEDGHGGSWAANIYTSKKAGTWTVTGNNIGFGLSDTAQLIVTNTAANRIVISPAAATITAGSNVTYTVEAFDLLDNSLGDVTGSTVFSITPEAGGSWAANVYTSAKASTWTVTGTYTGIPGTASLTVGVGPLHHIVISPAENTIMAGSTQAYAAESFDLFENSLGDVTGSTIFAILPPNDGGDWDANVYTSKKVGTWTVTGTYSGLPASPDTAALTVTNTPAQYIVISPDGAIITAGDSIPYTVEAFDLGDNSLGDVTAGTEFSIDFLAGGNWSGPYSNVYTSAKAGAWTVTGSYTGIIGTASLTVNVGPVHHIVISPAAANITAGDTQPYTVEAFDLGDNSLGNVTSTTEFSITPAAGGSWAANVYTSEVSGAWTVTGNNASLGLTDTALLGVF